MIPTGLPIWTRAAGFSYYGGHVNKQNHLSQGAIDPETDVTAAELQRLSADLAAVARTVPFGYFVVQCNDTSPAAPTVVLASMATGVRTTSYEGASPPSGFPSLARTANGRFTITFASSYADEFNVAASFVVQAGTGNNLSSGGGVVALNRISDVQLEVRAYDSATSVDSDALVCFTVYSGGG